MDHQVVDVRGRKRDPLHSIYKELFFSNDLLLQKRVITFSGFGQHVISQNSPNLPCVLCNTFAHSPVLSYAGVSCPFGELWLSDA